MNPISTLTPAVLPPDFLGLLVPGVLFAVWSVLVVAIVVGLCVVLALEARVEDERPSITVGRRPLAAGARNAA